jgi:hypothetical protein
MRNSGIAALFVSFGMILALSTAPAQADDCGDTSGPAGTDAPCKCGDTVTTNTVLGVSDTVVSTSVLDSCPVPGPALAVAATVTLDIAGQTIRCADNVNQVGIEIIGDGATVRKGIVKQCGIGIGGTTSNSTVESNRLQNDVVGVALTGDGNTVGGNVSIGDGKVSAQGFVITGDHNIIESNRCQQHFEEGLVVNGDANDLTRNYCYGNGDTGIAVVGTLNILTRNLGKNNGGHGIFAPGPGNVTDGTNFGSGNAQKPDCSINGQSRSADGRYC